MVEIKKEIDHCASKINEKIKAALNGKMFSLLLDIGSKNRRNILSVSAQFVENGKVVIHTLGMITLHRRHKSEYLKTKLKECLDLYGLSFQQIVSITVDNAKNMIKLVRLLNEQSEEDSDIISEEDENEIDSTSESEEGGMEEIDQLSNDEMDKLIDEMSNQAALQEIFAEGDEYMQYIESLDNAISEIAKGIGLIDVNTVRCGAH